MKKVFFFLCGIFFYSQLMAQAPQGISHQAVIRNSSNEIVTNSTVGIRVTILQGSESGTVVYRETHTPISNANGLITYIIGQGVVGAGVFATIDWSNGPYYLKSEADPAGGTSYTITGTTEILSVPYALHANMVENETQSLDNAYDHGRTINADNGPFEVGGNSGVLFGWSGAIGTIPATGAGRRLMWFPGKAAFRVGQVQEPFSTYWDNDSIGSSSVAMGVNTEAKGNSSFAMGQGTTASGDGSSATGWFTKALGDYSFSIGHYTTASGDYSSAMGSYVTAPSSYETVIGRYNTVYTPVSTTDWIANDRLFVIGMGTASGSRLNAMTVLKNGNIGLGMDVPAALLHTSGTGTGGGNVLFTGEFKTSSPGDPPASGTGTRMMWYPDKAAFRAGHLTVSNWDKDSIGKYSVATGFSTKAKGVASTAMGSLSIATGDISTVMGDMTTASGYISTAMGCQTTASGKYSTAMGYGTTASGQYSTAMGYYTTAHSGYETVIGRFNTEYVPVSTTVWDPTDRLFVIGRGMNPGSRLNAMTVLKNGNIGIGVDVPTALLHTSGTGTSEGNVMFTGSQKETPGDPPTSGAGTRMMWYPDKAAFRAGHVTGTQWDKDSIDAFSVAFGYNTRARGRVSTALGNNSYASGHSSTAMGGSTASGTYSTSMGSASKASGYGSTAMGIKTAASGYASTSMGDSTTTSGIISTAMGYRTTASGYCSTAMGYDANAIGELSFAINLNSADGPDVGESIFRISGASEIGGNVAWTNYSDQRLKKEIQALTTENNLEKISKLNGVRFRWKENDSLLNLGFIAQEVKDVIPECVRYDKLNDIYSMEYTAIIPVLAEGIKEQQKVIEAQQKDIKSLQQQIDELRKLIVNK